MSTYKKVSGVEGKADQQTAETNLKTATFAQLFSGLEAIDVVYIILGTLGALVTGASIPFFNVLFGRMLDALNGTTSSFSDQIKMIALAFVGVACVNLLSGFLQVYCWTAVGERQTQRLRVKYVRAILSQEIGWFDVCGAGQLSTKVAELCGKVQDGLGRKAGDLFQYITQVVAAFVVGLYLCWELTVVLLAAIPLIGVSGYFMITAITAAQNQASSQYAEAGGLASEALNGIRTITALNCQPLVISKYRIFLLDAMNVGITKGFHVGLGNGSVFGACFLTYALGFWYGAKLVADDLQHGCTLRNDCLTGGNVMAVFFCVILGSIALGQLAPPLVAFTSAKAAVAPMYEIIDRKPEIDGLSQEGLKPEVRPEGHIQIHDIMFSYPSRPDSLICKGYSLNIAKGETVALCGASGSGKSTVINLLLRFYDPQAGSITLDGINIRDLNIKWLRAQIGYVGQEPVLFSGTISENISYGLDPELVSKYFQEEGKNTNSDDVTGLKWNDYPKALQERIISACQLANAYEFISAFPNGFDTDVGANGVSMSGGQKQRIAIARAIVKRPSVLLLDEATSALDASSEKVVQQSIDALQQSKSQTTVVVAHRLSTIRNADKIAVVEGGVICEVGTHSELISRNGRYADLVGLQMSAQDDGITSDEQNNTYASGNKTNETIAVAGIESIDKTQSPEAFTSPVIAKSKEDLANEKKEASQVLNQIWKMVLQHPLWMFGGLLGAATFGSIFPVWGRILASTQAMFYTTDADSLREKSIQTVIYFCSLAAVAFVGSGLQFWGIAQVGERVSMRLRSDMFEAIMRREIGYFDKEENAVGTLTTRLSDDSRIVTKATGEALAKQLQAIFTLLIGLGIGLSASWKIALVVLATFPINIAASAIQMQAIAGQQYDQTAGSGEQAAIISSAFTHMRTVAAFSLQYKISIKYAMAMLVDSNARQSRSIAAGIGFGGSQMSLFLTYALLFWYGSTLILAGEVDFEQMMTSILCLMLGALGLGQAMTDIGDQKAGVEAAKRIFQAVTEGKESSIDGLSESGLKSDKKATGMIEIQNVSFFYPTRPEAEVCKGYNLKINPGETIALVGPSGSGKSTIINLLMRFYDPTEGSIMLDGTDLKDLNVRWLRSQIGYVGQEPVLFSGSIKENVVRGRAGYDSLKMLSLDEILIKYAKGELLNADSIVADNSADSVAISVAGDIEIGKVSDPDYVEACKASNAHDFISQFPEQYETDVGEGSMMVSGGQKQRIAIARALIKKPAVLLLDEATSALDAASEKYVQESIDALQRIYKQTTIIIAHRLSTIKNADKIAVIDKGVVVELGKHDELLHQNGLYAYLWSRQKGGITKSQSNDLLASLRGLE